MPLQDAKLNYGPMHVNGNTIVAIDIVTDGLSVLETTMYPLNHSYKADITKSPCYLKMRPAIPLDLTKITATYAKQSMQHLLDAVDGRTYFENWVDRVLNLKYGKKVMFVAWDWASIKPVLQMWLGSSFDELVHETVRDVNSIMNFLRDRMDAWGEDLGVRHDKFSGTLKAFNVQRVDNTSAGNARALAELYYKMCKKPFLTFDKPASQETLVQSQESMSAVELT